jgi:hypothetical protein
MKLAGRAALCIGLLLLAWHAGHSLADPAVAVPDVVDLSTWGKPKPTPPAPDKRRPQTGSAEVAVIDLADWSKRLQPAAARNAPEMTPPAPETTPPAPAAGAVIDLANWGKQPPPADTKNPVPAGRDQRTGKEEVNRQDSDFSVRVPGRRGVRN